MILFQTLLRIRFLSFLVSKIVCILILLCMTKKVDWKTERWIRKKKIQVTKMQSFRILKFFFKEINESKE